MIPKVPAWVKRLFVDTSVKVIDLREQLDELKAETAKRDTMLKKSERPDLNHTDEWWRHPDTETDSDAKQ